MAGRLAAKLHLCALICDWDEIENLRLQLPSIGTTEGVVSPFALLALEDAPDRHKIRAERFCAEAFAWEVAKFCDAVS